MSKKKLNLIYKPERKSFFYYKIQKKKLCYSVNNRIENRKINFTLTQFLEYKRQLKKELT